MEVDLYDGYYGRLDADPLAAVGRARDHRLESRDLRIVYHWTDELARSK